MRRVWVGLLAVMAGGMAPMPSHAEPLSEAFGQFTPSARATVDHSAWTKLLATYVVPSRDGINRVRYADFKREAHAELKAYIAGLEAVDVKGLGRSGQMAFWANLYNAKTIDIVLTAYPVKSIKDIRLGGGLVAAVTGGPWKAKVTTVGGHSLSLDDIEHGILRPVFKDPRVHYAVNCASIGCPNLAPHAFTAVSLDAQLDAGARAYVNHARGIKFVGGAVTASSIYDWFGNDFGGDAGVLAHVRSFAELDLSQKLQRIQAISAYDYDWSLNDAQQ